MPRLKPETTDATPEEEAAIQAAIEADPDSQELDQEWFARARPVSDEHPLIVERSKQRRGKQKAATKEHISIRLDADLAAHFRSTGPGWQSRLNSTLREAVFGRSD